MRIDEQVRAYLKSLNFAVLCVAVDLGAGDEGLVVVKTTGDAIEALKGASARVEVGWIAEPTGAGPVVCLVVRAGAHSTGELVGEVYFDPENDDDLALLETVAGQQRLRVAFLDEDLEPGWLAEVPWDEWRRLQVEQVRDRAEQLLEQAEAYDFDAARDAFQERFTLDDLTARIPTAS